MTTTAKVRIETGSRDKTDGSDLEEDEEIDDAEDDGSEPDESDSDDDDEQETIPVKNTRSHDGHSRTSEQAHQSDGVRESVGRHGSQSTTKPAPSKSGHIRGGAASALKTHPYPYNLPSKPNVPSHHFSLPTPRPLPSTSHQPLVHPSRAVPQPPPLYHIQTTRTHSIRPESSASQRSPVIPPAQSNGPATPMGQSWERSRGESSQGYDIVAAGQPSRPQNGPLPPLQQQNRPVPQNQILMDDRRRPPPPTRKQPQSQRQQVPANVNPNPTRQHQSRNQPPQTCAVMSNPDQTRTSRPPPATRPVVPPPAPQPLQNNNNSRPPTQNAPPRATTSTSEHIARPLSPTAEVQLQHAQPQPQAYHRHNGALFPMCLPAPALAMAGDAGIPWLDFQRQTHHQQGQHANWMFFFGAPRPPAQPLYLGYGHGPAAMPPWSGQ